MSAVVLLVETPDGPVGVRFPDTVAARAWEDDHAGDLTAVGCVPIVTKAEALRRA